MYNILDNKMQRRLQEQTRTIEYIKTKYKEKTGEDIVMPKSWEEYLSIEQEEAPIQPIPQIQNQNYIPPTFTLAIDALSLPSRISFSKAPFTSFNPSNRFHMIQNIDLSGFKDKGFTKNSLRELLGRIVDMRCLKMVSLRGNGLSQECAEEVEALLAIKRITRVDLSRNSMGKTCLQLIAKNFSHLQWVEQGFPIFSLSRNAFLYEKIGLQALLNTIRVNGKIFHMQIDWQDEKMLSTFCTYLKLKPHLRSLGPVDSKIPLEAMDVMCQVLETKESKKDSYRVFNLSFDFCYLQRAVFGRLCKALAINTTLAKLCLSNNHLGDDQARHLMQVLQQNISIVDLNLSGNLLEDQFAEALSKCLAKNEILQVVDISKNNIGPNGGKDLYKVLGQHNDTLESLGNFQTNTRLGPELTQKIKKVLRINRVSKEVRSKILSEEPDLPVTEVASRQTEAFLESEFNDYPLLQPIAVTNPMRQDPFRLNIWRFA